VLNNSGANLYKSVFHLLLLDFIQSDVG